MINPTAYVVMYKGTFYLHYKFTDTGQSLLINQKGEALRKPVPPSHLRVVKHIRAKECRGTWYVDTKLGVFSLATGRHIKSKAILSHLRG